MKSSIAMKKSVRLAVKYEKKVDIKCATQTSGNSSGKGQIWLSNKQLSSFAGVLESLANLMSFADSNEEHKEVRAICTLKPAPADLEYNSGLQFPIFSQGHLFGVELNSTDCNTEDTDNSNPCIDITNSTGNNSAYSTSLFERGRWPVAVLYCFCFVFVAVFVHYSPALLCLLSSTEVTEDGVRLIILEGASPVSVRSVMGNYFFSEDDGTIWRKARTFVFRAVIMPLPFLGLGILSDFASYTPQKYIMISCGCYFIQACYISFFAGRSIQAKPCCVCKLVKPKIFSCEDELPELIEGHLRLQPLILLECFRLFYRCIVRYFKMSVIVLPSWKVSVAQLLRFFIFVVFLSTIPAVAVILFIAILFLAFIGIAFSSPIVILCKARYTGINVPCFIVPVIRIVSTQAIVAVVFVAVSAAFGTLRGFLRGLKLLFSDDGLPYVACFVLVLYYVWSNYSSFTNKYQDLAFALFKHYKKSQNQKFDAGALNSTDQVQQHVGTDYEDNLMKIPKELFCMACEELMPIRDNVCVLVLKVTIIVSFVFLVFSIAILTNVGATPVMKAFLTFLTGIFPKIVAIYIDGGRHRKIEDMITEQRIPRILREYFKKALRSCQVRDNYGADVNETLSQNVNEENIELIIM